MATSRGAYYSENDPYCVQWLRNLIKAGLIADGDVDDRDIRLVKPEDVRGYRQAHFFAGLGGWSYALRLAQWPDDREAWTGSCPCQPFSSAARGRQRGTDDPRDLWPAWSSLIASSCPPVVFGEQVACDSAWLRRACDDMETVGRNFGAANIPACGVGADHARPRVYYFSNANRHSQSSGALDAEASRMPWRGRDPGGMVPTYGVSGRVAQLRAFGNAIHPRLAATFIEAAREAMMEQLYEAAA